MIKRVALYALALSLSATGIAHAQSDAAPAGAAGAAPTATDPAAAVAPAPAPAGPTPAGPTPAGPTQAEPAKAEEKGHIIFFRPFRLSGAIYTYHVVEVGDDGKPPKGAPHLGDLPTGGAFRYDAEPGIHSFNITGPMAINKDEDRIRMEVEPGETYYVEQTIRIGLVTGGFRLVPADEARFLATKVKLATNKPADTLADNKPAEK
jgi:hypothetical protein